MTLLLIDAYAMIYRAYYAFIRTPRMNSRGENTSAIYGFVITLNDLVKRLQPTHIGVAFDPHGKTFRHEAFEAYKAQREETPEDIRRAVPVIKDILTAMRIPILEVEGFEADDVIGTLAHKAEQELTAGDGSGMVYMATPDKDYGQLVSPHVRMYRPRHTGGFETLGVQEVCEKYGLQSQSQVIDLLALMGDAADNIPGCKGVGEKTAVALLQQFGSVENLLAHTDQLKGALQTKVATQAEQIRFSYFLATIRTDVPIALDWDLLTRREPDEEALYSHYRRLEFNSLLPKNSKTPPSPLQRGESGATTAASAKPSGQASLQLDLFGDTPEPATPINGSLTVINGEHKAASPASPINGSLTPINGEHKDHSTPINGATANNDHLELVQYLLNPEVAYNPDCPPSLDALRANEKLWRLYREVELPLVPVLRAMEAAGVRIDTDCLHEAERKLTAELAELEQHIRALIPADGQDKGKVLNINSPSQVGELLFDTLRLDPKAKKTKTGQYSTSEEVLLGLRDKHPIVGKILEYRELKKLISTYITALPTYIDPRDGKIHTTYNQTTTATGRLSSSNPNLQNLPIRSERGKLIREAVIPDPGCVFLSADYSQIELRLMAHFSQDPHLLEAFRAGQDIHAATAAKIFGVPIEEVTKDQRRRAKTANFGIIYGISAFGLSQQLGCSRTEAKQLIDDYFASFPRVADYIEAQKAAAREHGYAETLFGRRRYLPDILSHNATVRSFAERNAVNAPIQGTAADIIKMAMVHIAAALDAYYASKAAVNEATTSIAATSSPSTTPSTAITPSPSIATTLPPTPRAQMIMQVHDELNFNVPAADVEAVRRIVVEGMQNVVSLSVPLIAECGVGKNWLEAH